MATITQSRRRQRRHQVGRSAGAIVEFEFPAGGGRLLRFPVVNLSASGVSFALDEPDELPGLDPGASLAGSKLRIGDCLISGDLVVMHVTTEGAGLICGALFYPASDTDLVKLKSVVAGLEAAGPV